MILPDLRINKLSNCMKKILLLLSFLFFILGSSKAQISLRISSAYNNVRDHGLLENKKALISCQAGSSVRFFPFKTLPGLSVEAGISMNTRGYRQMLDENYSFKFNYASFSVLVVYSFTDKFSLNGGMEYSTLLSTNRRDGLKIYNHNDLALVGGFSAFDNQLVGFFVSCSIGLLPMLDYYKIDEMGNFTGKIHDLRNISVAIGLKLNFYHEKILLFKE